MPPSGYLLRDPSPKQNVRGAADTAQEGRHGHRASAFRFPLALEDAHKQLEVNKHFFSMWCQLRKHMAVFLRVRPEPPSHTISLCVCCKAYRQQWHFGSAGHDTHTHTHGPGLITHSRLVREIWNYDGTVPSVAWLLLWAGAGGAGQRNQCSDKMLVLEETHIYIHTQLLEETQWSNSVL